MANEAHNLHLEWNVSLRKEWVTVKARGEDSEAFLNLLRRKFSQVPVDRSHVEKWDNLKGFLTGAGRVGYGVYVDVGILDPAPKDALYPLHSMRAQLSDGIPKPAREILIENALVDYFPVRVVVTGLDGDKVSVELADESRGLLLSWQKHPFDRVVMVGLTFQEAKNMVRAMRLNMDVVRVESLSLLAQCLILKVGTHAPGIIAKVGRRLGGVALAAYRSRVKID